MTFDLGKVPGGDVARWGDDCRAKATAGVDAADWRAVHDWTKSWIGWGGGAWVPDSWLLYAVSALLKGEPRNAVHSLDLGIGTWLEGDADRGLLAWCRGTVVWRRLSDPKTALSDLESSADLLPGWLHARPDDLIAECSEAASNSRKRVPSVKPRPVFAGAEHVRHVVAPSVVVRRDGDKPIVWDRINTFFA